MAAFHAACCNPQVQRPKANAKSLFVKPSLRKGILPSILGALIEARKATRAALKVAQEPTTRAILDSRQKALKLTASELCSRCCIIICFSLRATHKLLQALQHMAACCSAKQRQQPCNTGLPPSSCHMRRHGAKAAGTARCAAADALYGFTGAQASNLQSVALADSCLALGAKVGPCTEAHRTVSSAGWLNLAIPSAAPCVTCGWACQHTPLPACSPRTMHGRSWRL